MMISTPRQEDVLQGPHRIEKDLLGPLAVPADAYYGVQTQRALENFILSGVPLAHFSKFIVALAMVKKASAAANYDIGLLDKRRFEAIAHACDRLSDGEFHEQFVVDMIQGGAGTSTNMNANEVIANIGLEYLGHKKGEYSHLHPNNDVNMSQSTNDVYPTAIRIALQLYRDDLADSLTALEGAFAAKGDEFADVIKMGRTQLQDAVPMTLGQEFHAFANTLSDDLELIDRVYHQVREVNLGGTAIGTGINADPRYAVLAVDHLSRITGHPIRLAKDLIAATSDMGAFVIFSGVTKRLAIKLSKISNDLRLLSSGPRTGLAEINLPPQQPGSSIMPGKVNPVIPEAMNQVAYEVIGNDLSITMAAENGQLQLNVMEPLIAFKLLESMRLLRRAMDMLRERCVVGITANREHCRNLVDHSIGVITALNPYIGYDNATAIAAEAQATGRGVVELVRERGLLEEDRLQEILKPENMVQPRSR